MSGQTGARVQATLSPARVINWRGHPQVVTVTLLPIALPTSDVQLAQFNSLDPFRAKVTWGNGQAASTAVIDYPISGGTFTLSASSVTVDVYPDGVATPPSGTTVFPDLLVGAFLGLGASRPGTTPPTTTVNFTGDPLAPVTVQVPPHARAYYVEDSNPVVGFTQRWRVELLNIGAGGIPTNVQRTDDVVSTGFGGQVSLYGPTQFTPAPLPPRVGALRVQLGAMAVPQRSAVVFIADLGG